MRTGIDAAGNELRAGDSVVNPEDYQKNGRAATVGYVYAIESDNRVSVVWPGGGQPDVFKLHDQNNVQRVWE